MPLFEYAVLLSEKLDKDEEVVEEEEVVIPVTVTVARDENQAQMIASRAVPEEFMKKGKLNRLVVVIRPF